MRFLRIFATSAPESFHIIPKAGQVGFEWLGDADQGVAAPKGIGVP